MTLTIHADDFLWWRNFNNTWNKWQMSHHSVLWWNLINYIFGNLQFESAFHKYHTTRNTRTLIRKKLTDYLNVVFSPEFRERMLIDNVFSAPFRKAKKICEEFSRVCKRITLSTSATSRWMNLRKNTKIGLFLRMRICFCSRKKLSSMGQLFIMTEHPLPFPNTIISIIWTILTHWVSRRRNL